MHNMNTTTHTHHTVLTEHVEFPEGPYQSYPIIMIFAKKEGFFSDRIDQKKEDCLKTDNTNLT